MESSVFTWNLLDSVAISVPRIPSKKDFAMVAARSTLSSVLLLEREGVDSWREPWGRTSPNRSSLGATPEPHSYLYTYAPASFIFLYYCSLS